MILNQSGDEFEYRGIIYRIGASVRGISQNEYAGLYGTITEIRDGKDRETNHGTPDLYCSFEIPALPCEARCVEEKFFDLYHRHKGIEDILSNPVIMRPEMVELLDDLRECRTHLPVFVLTEDWAVSGEQGHAMEIYTEYDDAKRMLVRKLKEEQDKGCIQNWKDRKEFEEDSGFSSYECCLEGEYCGNHYSISIEERAVCAGDRFLREAAEIHTASCRMEDFASYVSDWEEAEKLTDAQYRRMIKDSRFPDRFQKALGKNDSYWEAYWATVSSVAQDFLKEYLEHAEPDTIKSEGGQEE